MASELERKENYEVTLTIEVAPEEFNDAMQRAFKKNANRFVIPGFRKGKAPMGLVTKYYGEGVLYEDAIDIALGPAYKAAVAEQNIEPVTQPQIEIIHIGLNKGLKFKATVTVKPDVTLGQYLGVEAEKPEFTIEDQAVEEELRHVQERNSRLIPVDDRPVREGDTVNIDYEGRMDGVPFEGGEGESFDLKIGSHNFIPGFEEQLIGHNSGESFDIEVTFPEDYYNKEIAGKNATFSITINSIKMTELPELDDEFAKDVSEFDTLEEYKESLRQKLEENAKKESDRIFEENVIRAVVDQAEIDIPKAMVDVKIEQMIDQQRYEMRYQGFELEQFLSYTGQNLDEYKEQYRDLAENEVRTQLVLEAIAAAESLEVTEEELNAEIEKMARMYQMTPEDVKSRFFAENDDLLKEPILRRKAIELIVEKAVPVPVSTQTVEMEKPSSETKENSNEETAEEQARTEPVGNEIIG